MNLYDALKNVAKASRVFANGTQVTEDNRESSVQELEEFVVCTRIAYEAGAEPYDLEQAAIGQVASYLKE